MFFQKSFSGHGTSISHDALQLNAALMGGYKIQGGTSPYLTLVIESQQIHNSITNQCGQPIECNRIGSLCTFIADLLGSENDLCSGLY